MGFRALRVMNEDRVAPGHGYGTHARRDVEIVTYVLVPDAMDRPRFIRTSRFSCLLQESEAASLTLQPGRHAWVQLVRGTIQLNNVALTV